MFFYFIPGDIITVHKNLFNILQLVLCYECLVCSCWQWVTDRRCGGKRDCNKNAAMYDGSFQPMF